MLEPSLHCGCSIDYDSSRRKVEVFAAEDLCASVVLYGLINAVFDTNFLTCYQTKDILDVIEDSSTRVETGIALVEQRERR